MAAMEHSPTRHSATRHQYHGCAVLIASFDAECTSQGGTESLYRVIAKFHEALKTRYEDPRVQMARRLGLEERKEGHGLFEARYWIPLSHPDVLATVSYTHLTLPTRS